MEVYVQETLQKMGIQAVPLLNVGDRLRLQSAALEATDNAIVITDLSGQILWINSVFTRLTGYALEDLYGKTLRVLKTGALDEQFYQDLWDTILAGQVWQGEIKNRRKDNSAYIEKMTITPVRDETGVIANFVAVMEDISERDQAVELLMREKALLRSLIDSIPDLIFYKDIHGVYRGCNLAFTHFSGRSAREIIGRTDHEIYSEARAAYFTSADREVLREGRPVQYQEWAKDPRGRPVYIVTLKTPYHDAAGEMMGVIGIGRDATDLKMAEEALQRSHGENEQLIASLSSMLIGLSPAMHITQWNPKAVEILGIDAVDAENWNIGDLDLPWNWPGMEVDFARAQEQGAPLYLDPVPFDRPDGSDGFLGMSITPIFGDNRRLSGFILMGADITKRKILEQRLSQAEKLEAIGQLAAGIAHEINTPTQYVNDNLHFLDESWVEVFSLLNLYRELVAKIQNAGVSLEQFGRIEQLAEEIDVNYLAKEIPLAVTQSLEGIARVAEIVRAMKRFSYMGGEEKQSVDLNLAVESTINVARNEWKYVAVVEMDLDPSLPPVTCLPGEINQVFLNLITNAAHAIEDRTGGKGEKGSIKIRTLFTGAGVEIRVSDTGMGIPEEIQNRIFDPFFTTKDVGRGTGQGLAISYDVVVKKHGGEIFFETERGVGTTFIVRLPIESHQETNGDLLNPWLNG